VLNVGGNSSAGASQGSGGITDACVTDAVVGEQLPIDLYMMFDKSGSMACRPDESVGLNCDDEPGPEARWTAVTTALKSFINSPDNAGIGVGVGFFPRFAKYDPACGLTKCLVSFNDSCLKGCGCEEVSCSPFCSCKDKPVDACEPVQYEAPTVPIGVLPGSAAALVTEIDAQAVAGGTPTTPALSGALAHAAKWATDHPDRNVALVFATDGEPDGCAGNNIENAAKAASTAFAATPSIPTYVIGIGPSLENLNAIAEAGGTKQAYLLGASTDAVTEFSKALQSIRGRTLSCDYKIPEKSDLDYSKVNVNVSVGSGAPTLVGQAASAEQCEDNSDGWYYDNPAAPKLIKLCKKTCDSVLAAAGSKLEVLIGCKTIVNGPK
jgi:hypothetical protein